MLIHFYKISDVKPPYKIINKIMNKAMSKLQKKWFKYLCLGLIAIVLICMFFSTCSISESFHPDEKDSIMKKLVQEKPSPVDIPVNVKVNLHDLKRELLDAHCDTGKADTAADKAMRALEEMKRIVGRGCGSTPTVVQQPVAQPIIQTQAPVLPQAVVQVAPTAAPTPAPTPAPTAAPVYISPPSPPPSPPSEDNWRNQANRPAAYNNCNAREEIRKCSKAETDTDDCNKHYVIDGDGEMYDCIFNSSIRECEKSNTQCGQEA